MIRFLSLLCCSLILASCTSDAEKAKQLLADSLVIKTDLEFNDVTNYPGNVVCGGFSAYISYSEPPLKQAPFIVVEGVLDRSPSPLKWSILCTETPAESLHRATGIGPITAASDELIKITRDMTLLSTLLEAYYDDNSVYPLESDGLGALIRKPEGDRFIRNYPEGGYATELPLDPWGRPYVYSHTRWGRVKGAYELITLGKSGEPGGSGLETDISSKYLVYFQHIARLLGVELPTSD